MAELSEDSESLPSIEGFSDSDSMSDEFEDLEGAFGEVKFENILVAYHCHVYFTDICLGTVGPV